MIIFPAIDLKDGLCVRLMQGDPGRATVYGTDPAEVARHWESLGAEWLHVVDLDGAFSRAPVNDKFVKEIAKSVSIPIQVGGGIRNIETIEDYLSSGIARVILGTVAISDPRVLEEACSRFPGRIVLGIDARDGQVAVEGWKESTRADAVSLARDLSRHAIAAIIYTDIHRDGMQSGVNIEATRRLIEAVPVPVIASGGVSSLDDIEALLPLVPIGLAGVITGRAIYAGTMDLEEAIRFVRESLRPRE